MTATDAHRLSDLKNTLKEIGPLGTAIGAVAGAGILYVIGGMVVLVRLHQADLPVEQGLDVIPREQLLLVGVREVIVVLALSVALVFLLRLPWPSLVILAVVVFLFAPLTLAGLAWPIVILGVLGLWLVLKESSTGWALLAIPILVLFVVVLRYNDPPSRFPEGNLWTDERPISKCRADGPEENSTHASRCGLFLSINDEYVYIGIPGGGQRQREILGVPKAKVKKLFLTDHEDRSAPRLSLVGRVTRRLGWPAISCNPLECWFGSKNIGSRVFG